MNCKCLYCYQPLLHSEADFHPRCSELFFGTAEVPVINYSLADMAAMASQLIQTSVAVPGVQPKLLLEKDALTIAGKGGGNYIIKPPNPDYSQLPENEHVSMLMAKEVFGINTAPHSLIRLSSGELAYITRRMDRTMDGTFIHMLDMFQVLEAYDKYIGSMEKVGRAISLYSSSPLSDAGNYFELVLFCFLTGNNDMHLKNFSMIRNGDFWNLAPAYDLLNVSIANPKDVEEMALTLGGKKRKFSRQYFTDFGLKLGLSVIHINDLFERIKDKVPKVIALLKQSFLTTENQEDYEALFRKRLDMLHIVSRE